MRLWIVHREPAARTALARLVAGGGEATRAPAPVSGPPQLDAFPDAAPPEAVLMGLAGDLDAEQAFARALRARYPDVALVLVHAAAREDEVAARFEELGAERLVFPPTSEALRAALRSRAAARRDASLATRRRRALLEERFERWFADLPLPSPGAPAWRRRRALVRGEPGSGRMLLARALHERGAARPGAFVHVPCEPRLDLAGLVRSLAALSAAGPIHRSAGAATVCLEGVEVLRPGVQRALRSWIELGPPEIPGSVLAPARLRWIAVADLRGPALDAGLVDALADLSFRIPPLRERPDAVAPFVEATAASWASADGVPPRPFEPDALARLGEDPWPGNLRELEAVVVRCLAAGGETPVTRPEVEAQLAAGVPAAAAAQMQTPRGPQAAPAPPTHPTAAAAKPTGAAAERPRPVGGGRAGAPAEARGAGGPGLPRLARSLAHELRNPLTGIRTFAALLPERFDDAEFREGFRSRVEEDVGRMEGTLDRLQAFASLGPRSPGPVDVAALLEELLESRRPEIQRRRLLVLQELDATRPWALADAGRLRFAFESLLDCALGWMPDRADLYVASRHHPAEEGVGEDGEPTLRVLLRFHHPGGVAAAGPATGPEAREDVAPRENAVELALAEAALRGEGGRLTLDAVGDETVVVLDLAAPDPEGASPADARPARG